MASGKSSCRAWGQARNLQGSELVGAQVELEPLKSDPLALYAEVRPATASIVVDATAQPKPRPAPGHREAALISIYEDASRILAAPAEEGSRWLTYRELADELPAYAADMGFTHVEFMPSRSIRSTVSWGYPAYRAVRAHERFGTPEDFVALVDACHRAGLGVLVD